MTMEALEEGEEERRGEVVEVEVPVKSADG